MPVHARRRAVHQVPIHPDSVSVNTVTNANKVLIQTYYQVMKINSHYCKYGTESEKMGQMLSAIFVWQK